jgi:hypothetical protein
VGPRRRDRRCAAEVEQLELLHARPRPDDRGEHVDAFGRALDAEDRSFARAARRAR